MTDLNHGLSLSEFLYLSILQRIVFLKFYGFVTPNCQQRYLNIIIH